MRPVLIALLLPILVGSAAADDLASPSGEAWWKRLAECGGITLVVRDKAAAAGKPSADLAVLTVRMNAFLDAAKLQLAKDRGIEESPAKRTVYQTAGAQWQATKDNSAAPNLSEAEAACDRDLQIYKNL